MANIPVLTQRSIADSPLEPAAPNLNFSGMHPTGGVDDLARAGDALMATVQRARQEADVANQTAASNELTASIDTAFYTPPPRQGQNPIEAAFDSGESSPVGTGLLHRQGEDAVAASQPTYAWLASERQRIAEKYFQSEEQKQHFLLHTGGMMEDAHRQGERHVAQQIEASNQADIAAGKRLSLGTIAKAASDDNADAIIARQTARMEGPIRALARTKAEGDVLVQEWRGQVAGTVLNSRLDSGDYKGASAFFANPEVRDALGENAHHYQHTIEAVRTQYESVDKAQAVVSAARKPVVGLDGQPLAGFLDKGKLEKALAEVPPGPQRPAIETEVRRQQGLALEVEKQAKADAYDAGLQGYLKTGVIPAKPYAWLEENDPEGALKLKRVQQADAEHARVGRKTAGATDTDQLAAYSVLINKMADSPEEFKGMDAKVFQRDNFDALGPKFYKAAAEKLAHIKGATDKDLPLTGEPVLAAREAAKAVFHEAKADTKAWSPEHQQFFTEALDYIQKQASVWSKNNHGKTPDAAQYKKWQDDKLGQVTVDPGSWSFNRKMSRVEYEHSDKYKDKPLVGAPPPAAGPVRQKGKDGHTWEWDAAKKSFKKVD